MAPPTARSGTPKQSKKTNKPRTETTSKVKKHVSTHKATGEQKTKRVTARDKPKKKQRTYTDKELGIPSLNMITPAGVQKPKGKKKGKVFVDDQESMMTILAMVNADKEGQIESKMMKARQMEEIRQARQAEMDARQHEKKSKLEDAKNSLRRGTKNKSAEQHEEKAAKSVPKLAAGVPRKRVSFE